MIEHLFAQQNVIENVSYVNNSHCINCAGMCYGKCAVACEKENSDLNDKSGNCSVM